MTSSTADLLWSWVPLVSQALGIPEGATKVAPGNEVAWDLMDCDTGIMAWVRLVQVAASGNSLLSPSRLASGGICVPTWALQVGVGALRCVAGPGEDGSPPSPEQQTVDGLNCLEDMAALGALVTEQLGPSNIPSWQSLGPQGNVAGGEWTFAVAADAHL